MKDEKKCAVLGLTNEGLYAAIFYAELGYQVILVDQDDKRLKQYERGWIPWHNEKWMKQFSLLRSQFYFMKKEEFLTQSVAFYAVTEKEESLFSWFSFFLSIKQKKLRFIFHSMIPVGTTKKVFSLFSHFVEQVSLIYFPFFLDGQKVRTSFPWLIGCQNDEDHAFMSLLLSPYLSENQEWIYSDLITVECAAYLFYDYQRWQQTFVNQWSQISSFFHANQDILSYFMKMIPLSLPHTQQCADCFEKEAALQTFRKQISSQVSFSSFSEKEIPTRILEHIKEEKPKVVAVLGVCPKEKEEYIEQFYSLPLLHQLVKEGIVVHIYDPYYLHLFKSYVQDKKNVVYDSSIFEAIRDADLILALTKEKEWEELPSSKKVYRFYQEYV